MENWDISFHVHVVKLGINYRYGGIGMAGSNH
jgi:hypothetical protein